MEKENVNVIFQIKEPTIDYLPLTNNDLKNEEMRENILKCHHIY